MKARIVRDTIYGYITFPSDLFESLIDTELFQRLRKIKQLGLTNYVYPSANHTRFEHSLGVAYAMKRAIEKIEENTRNHILDKLSVEERVTVERVMKMVNELKKEAVVAALLHDIGHIILSHVTEFKKVTDTFYPSLRFDHEYLTLNVVDMIDKDIRYGGEKVDMEVVRKILNTAYKKSEEERLEGEEGNAIEIIASLLSGEIDLDRADYILRDGYFTNVGESRYDMERLYEVLVLFPSQNKEEGNRVIVGIIDKGISLIENMILSRVYMYSDVYLHQVSMLFEAVAKKLIALFFQLVSTDDNVREKFKVIDPDDCFIMVLGEGYKKLRKEDFGKLERCLSTLVDDFFHSLLLFGRRLALDQSINLPCEKRFTLYLYSQSLLRRRKLAMLYDPTAEELWNLINEANTRVFDTIKRYSGDLVIFDVASYVALKGSEEIQVFDRQRRVVKRVSSFSQAAVSRYLKDKVYAKAIIVFPTYSDEESPPPGWNLKRDNGVQEIIEEFEREVKCEVDDEIRRARRNAMQLASELRNFYLS